MSKLLSSNSCLGCVINSVSGKCWLHNYYIEDKYSRIGKISYKKFGFIRCEKSRKQGEAGTGKEEVRKGEEKHIQRTFYTMISIQKHRCILLNRGSLGKKILNRQIPHK